jgi:FkbM family methyltransferase
MSHDLKKFKLIKKILGIFGYKIIDKNSVKTERVLERNLLSGREVIEKLINSNLVNKIVQIGSNNGQSDDFLNIVIKNNKKLKALLVEPVKETFEELKKNYLNYNNIILANYAVDLFSGNKNIFKVDSNYFNYYANLHKTITGSWINVLASFDRKHLIKHGVKNDHIISELVDCLNFEDLFSKYNFNDLDLLIIDTEGYDHVLLENLINTKNYRPFLIFEWIHIPYDKAYFLFKALNRDYNIIKIQKDIVCLKKNITLNL